MESLREYFSNNIRDLTTKRGFIKFLETIQETEIEKYSHLTSNNEIIAQMNEKRNNLVESKQIKNFISYYHKALNNINTHRFIEFKLNEIFAILILTTTPDEPIFKTAYLDQKFVNLICYFKNKNRVYSRDKCKEGILRFLENLSKFKIFKDESKIEELINEIDLKRHQILFENYPKYFSEFYEFVCKDKIENEEEECKINDLMIYFISNIQPKSKNPLAEVKPTDLDDLKDLINYLNEYFNLNIKTLKFRKNFKKFLNFFLFKNSCFSINYKENRLNEIYRKSENIISNIQIEILCEYISLITKYKNEDDDDDDNELKEINEEIFVEKILSLMFDLIEITELNKIEPKIEDIDKYFNNNIRSYFNKFRDGIYFFLRRISTPKFRIKISNFNELVEMIYNKRDNIISNENIKALSKSFLRHLHDSDETKLEELSTKIISRIEQIMPSQDDN